jgi:hypothetical protein
MEGVEEADDAHHSSEMFWVDSLFEKSLFTAALTARTA